MYEDYLIKLPSKQEKEADPNLTHSLYRVTYDYYYYYYSHSYYLPRKLLFIV